VGALSSVSLKKPYSRKLNNVLCVSARVGPTVPGKSVGIIVGAEVATVGLAVNAVGAAVPIVGLAVGIAVGLKVVGATVAAVGADVAKVGLAVAAVGATVGATVGLKVVGAIVGATVSPGMEGAEVVVTCVGVWVGSCEGS
jgi:hypothetical protein